MNVFPENLWCLVEGKIQSDPIIFPNMTRMKTVRTASFCVFIIKTE